jgi:hypothetical protein
MRYGVVFLVIAFLAGGCSRQVLLHPEEVVQHQTVSVRLQSGQQVTGEVEAMQAGILVVKDRDGQAWRAETATIAKITGPKPVFDGAGEIIPEKEIASRETSKNRLLFSLSGGVLSLGTSFFLSSMLSRALGDDQRDAVLYGGSAGGTLVGVWLFHGLGRGKDRQQAIQEIRQERASHKGVLDLQGVTKKREQVQSELDKLRQDRLRQDEEIKKLQQRIQEKQKK